MLARLEMKLSHYEGMSYHMSSLFHGALMELISPYYADELHMSQLHPYTQHLERRGNDWYWVVTTLNEEARYELIDTALWDKDHLYINKKGLNIGIINRSYTELADRELADSFYNGAASRYHTLQFVTPAAFKVNGRYVNYPDIRSIYASLMNKYDAFNQDESMKDEESLRLLTSSTSVNRYELRSASFSLEGIRIPSFLGKMTFKVDGAQTLCNFADMLFRFGEYSGIGIKTALGMGAVRLLHNDAGGSRSAYEELRN